VADGSLKQKRCGTAARSDIEQLGRNLPDLP